MATKLQTVERTLEDLGSIDNAMANAFSEIEAVAKDKVNPHFKSKYADLGSVIDSIRPILAKHNLYFVQCCEPSEDGVVVQTIVRHVSGSSIDFGKLYVPANKRDAQGFGSALTYARRYALVTAFGVPTEDDDGNAAVRTAANPNRGEERPANAQTEDGGNPTGERLEGDMSNSALRGSIKTLIHNINGCGSLREFEELLELQEAVDTIEQCKRRFPAWWETGAGCPAEFRPLKKILEETRRGLAQLESA